MITNVGSNADDDIQKWACEYCTYLNYPSAQKCTICRSAKPLHLILAHGQDLNLANESSRNGSFNDVEAHDRLSTIQPTFFDIYQLAASASSGSINGGQQQQQSQQQQQPPRQKSNSLISDLDADKWSCVSCTYLNFPRSQKCTQCSRPRSLEIRTSSSSSTNFNDTISTTANITALTPSQQQQLSPSEKVCSPPPGCSNQSQQQQQQQPQQPQQPPAFESRILAKKLQKWTCSACTYENWPKSGHCIMCYTLKSGNTTYSSKSQETSSRSGGSRATNVSRSINKTAETITGEGGNEKKRSLSSGKEGGRKSPKNSSSSESVNSDQFSVSAGASSTVSLSMTATSTPSCSSSPQVVTTTAEQQHQPYDLLEKTMRRLKKQLRDVDYLWLTALKSIVVDELADCCDPVEAYIAAGGDPARVLTHGEVHILNRSLNGASFEAGHTLFHLAIRYRREDLLTLLLACSERPINGASRPIRRVPCHMSPDTATDIRRQIHMSLRQRKGEVTAYFFTDVATFSLSSSIYELPLSIRNKLFDALLDRSVQKELEEYLIINWSVELTDRLGSRLFALWNRMCGDCLLDSVLQATWGVFDSENSLRQALADSLSDAADMFYPRWREYEAYLASLMHYTKDDEQYARDWDSILQLANQPGAALEQAHIFVLAHIIRRPIIVYGVRVVKSYYSGESIDYARFEGVYLPLLWESSFCWRSPICLSYTRNHFTALVPTEPEAYEIGAMARMREFPQQPRYVYLPLKDSDGRMLPVHFTNASERGHEQSMLKAWLDVCFTEGGLWCCKMRLHRLSPIVQQMVDDWLDYYRRLAQLHQAASSALTRYGSSNQGKPKYNDTATVGTIMNNYTIPIPGITEIDVSETTSNEEKRDNRGDNAKSQCAHEEKDS